MLTKLIDKTGKNILCVLGEYLPSIYKELHINKKANCTKMMLIDDSQQKKYEFPINAYTNEKKFILYLGDLTLHLLETMVKFMFLRMCGNMLLVKV